MAQGRDQDASSGRRQERGRSGEYRFSAEGRERDDMERFRTRADQRQDFSRRRWDDDYQGDWSYGDDEQFSARQGQQRYNPGGSTQDPQRQGYLDYASQQGERRGGEPDWRGVQRSQGLHSGKGPKGYQRSDERIREEICDRLSDHHDIDASEIEVKVENGEVTLTGSVTERRAKRLAEDVVDDIRGVRDVHNQLRVGVGETSPTRAGSQAGEPSAPARH